MSLHCSGLEARCSGRMDRLFVRRDDFGRWTAGANLATLDPYRALAKLLHLVEVVGNEEHRRAAFAELANAFLTLLFKRGVTDAEDLIEQDDIRVNRGCDRECETRDHACRIRPKRRVERRSQSGEAGDLL